MKTGAFFDLDGTIVRGTSGIRFARFLVRRRILPLKVSAVLPALKTAYNYISGRVEKYMDEVDDLLAMSIKGLEKKKIKEQAKQYAGLEMHYVYKKSKELIKAHKKKGHKLFLLSVTNDELVKEVGKLLGFHKAMGTQFKVENGKYTGEIKKPSLIGKDRVKIVKNLAKEYKIDLKKSYAYGNCINDLEVLKAVGNPFAVNPNHYLKPIAEKKKWKII